MDGYIKDLKLPTKPLAVILTKPIMKVIPTCWEGTLLKRGYKKVCFIKKLEMPYAEAIFHVSYGMVELPSGRMKSREGTVVDADDLVAEMIKEAEKKTAEKSKVDEFSHDELQELYSMIALGALKFLLLKVDPKKKMVFNPEESID